MNIRSTMKIYPRPDTYYRNKSSLDFDMMKTKIMEERSGSGKESMILWIAHVVVGIGMGTIAFMMTLVEDKLTEWRYTTVQNIITANDNYLLSGYFFYVGTAMTLVLVSVLMTIYIGPGAMGSGTAEVMGMLNGVNYPDAIGFKTLFVKCFGTTLAVLGGLCIGKEGPLVHIGANVGAISCYMPLKSSKYL